MKNKKNYRQRNIGIDLLRIVSMLLIILLHSIDHSGVIEVADANGGAMGVYVRFLYILVQVCVNCYVHFLVQSEFKIQKLVVLWMEVVFYSFSIKFVFMIMGYEPFSIVSLVSCLVPIFTGRYWFITIYFGLYLIAPFLNIAIHAMNKKQHLKLNILLFVLFSLMVSVYPSFAGMNSGGGWGLAWFTVLYLAAAWFRLYYKSTGKVCAKLLGWFVIAIIVTVIYNFGQFLVPLRTIASNWYRYDSVPAYLMSLIVFIAFLNIRIENKYVRKIIEVIAPATLGVYLIHAHASFSPWSWEVTDLPSKMNLSVFPILQLGIVVAIFISCAIIDIIRKQTIGRIENNAIISKICSRVEEKARKIRIFGD